MSARLHLCAALCAVGLAACGGSAGTPNQAQDQPAGPAATAPPAARSPLELPQRVPLKPTGAAVEAQAAVVRAWSKALRAGDVTGASALWAIPAKVQNGTPVLTLSSRAEVLAFNATLPCGSIVTAAGAASGYTITTFRLTDRKGGACDAAAGATARTAIRVRDGKIVEWYRLPDDPDAPGLRTDDVESTTV
jgi:limonene-1,2-epoxide hydrolase